MWTRRHPNQVSIIRVLLVDDNSTFLRNTTEFLQQQHELLIVGTAHGGANALVKAQELRPEVIVIDLSMPGLSGLETIPRLKNMLPAARIIGLDVHDSSAMRQAALAAGADDLIAKATMSTNLLPAIRRVAQTGQPEEDSKVDHRNQGGICHEEET